MAKGVNKRGFVVFGGQLINRVLHPCVPTVLVLLSNVVGREVAVVILEHVAPAPRAPGLEVLKLIAVAAWIARTSFQPIAGIRAYRYVVALRLVGPFNNALWKSGLISNQFSTTRPIDFVLVVVEDELFVSVNDGDRPGQVPVHNTVLYPRDINPYVSIAAICSRASDPL